MKYTINYVIGTPAENMSTVNVKINPPNASEKVPLNVNVDYQTSESNKGVDITIHKVDPINVDKPSPNDVKSFTMLFDFIQEPTEQDFKDLMTRVISEFGAHVQESGHDPNSVVTVGCVMDC